MITSEQIKELRDMTGISVMQCKKALEEAGGDKEKALAILRKKSGEIALKKADRELSAGVVQSYIHSNGSVGVLLELLCETDFVAKNEEFKALAYDIAMHIAAMNPRFLDKDNVDQKELDQVRILCTEEVSKMDKPENIKATILERKIETYVAERTLLSQPFIKNGEITISGLIEQAVQKFGEKTAVGRFTRFSIGEA